MRLGNNWVTDCPARHAWFGALALVAALSLSACGKEASKQAQAGPSLALAKVNDVEIAMVPGADDVAPASGAAAATEPVVDQKMLELLIDRQLLREEAMRNKLDRDPQVIEAIDRAKTEILAQAYLQSKFAAIGAPSAAEVDAYFRAHPELFTHRKMFAMKQLVVATKDFSAQLRTRLDSAGSIEQVAQWLDKNHVKYERTQLSRSTADLAPEMIARLQTMRKNQLFVIGAGEYSMLAALVDVKPNPVTAAAAAPEIALYLRNKKRKEIGDAELGRLRATAKVDYIEKKQAAAATVPQARLAGSPTVQAGRGITGTK